MHFINGDEKRKYIILHGLDVCATTWYLIHGIPKSTFRSYVERHNEGFLSIVHGNKSYKQLRVGIVQVMATASIVKENRDHMLHQMRRIKHGRMDSLKYLFASNN